MGEFVLFSPPRRHCRALPGNPPLPRPLDRRDKPGGDDGENHRFSPTPPTSLRCPRAAMGEFVLFSPTPSSLPGSSRQSTFGALPDRRNEPGGVLSLPYFIVGIWNSAPSLMPLGQRLVTVLVRVQKRMESVPCWLRSPKALAFQPPKP